MGNHPNRSKANRNLAATPTPNEIKEARERASMTQSVAGATIRGTMRSWQDYEAGARRMHPGLFELFLIKTGQR